MTKPQWNLLPSRDPLSPQRCSRSALACGLSACGSPLLGTILPLDLARPRFGAEPRELFVQIDDEGGVNAVHLWWDSIFGR